MTFDIDSALGDMLGSIAGVLAGEWPKVKSCVEQALQDEKDALKTIAQARLDVEIDDEEMQSELDDERETLKAVLLVCQIEAEAMAQQAANAATKAFIDAIKAVL